MFKKERKRPISVSKVYNTRCVKYKINSRRSREEKNAYYTNKYVKGSCRMNERKYKLNFKRKTNRKIGRKEEKKGKNRKR